MDSPEQQRQGQDLRDHSWTYLSFHSKQRAQTFRIFTAIGAALSLGIALLLHFDAGAAVAAPLGFLLAALGILFWILDAQRAEKVKRGEAAVRRFDEGVKLPNEKGGGPHPFLLLESSDAKARAGGGLVVESLVCLVFVVLGLYYAAASFCPKLVVSPHIAAVPSSPTATPAPATPAYVAAPTPFPPYPNHPYPPRFTPSPNGFPPNFPRFTPPGNLNHPPGPLGGSQLPPANLPRFTPFPRPSTGPTPVLNSAAPVLKAPASPATPAPAASSLPSTPQPAATQPAGQK